MTLRIDPPEETKRNVISDWLDENVGAIDPGMDEIAYLIIDKMLVEHSCCDTQTWQFNDELYQRVLNAK
jgi:hypothetical protein